MTVSHYRAGAAGTAGAGFRCEPVVPRQRSGDEEGAGKGLSVRETGETGPSGVSRWAERDEAFVTNETGEA